MSAVVVVSLLLSVSQAAAQPAPAFRSLTVEGMTVFSPTEVRWWLDLAEGRPLPDEPSALAQTLRRRYAQEGFSAARVEALFDESTGRLRLIVDEGRIDEIEFDGVEPPLADRLRPDFSIRPGDLYNRRETARAIRRLLAPMRGALRVDQDGHELIDRSGRRVLVVRLRREDGRVRLDFGGEAREDWYSPVDGFAPALGFNATIFDHSRFNHTYVRGFLTYKFAREEAGYSIGFERPVVGGPDRARLFIGAEAHEMTATDDLWRLSTLEQSLASLVFRNSFRDYHDRRGYQLHAAYRFSPSQEIIAAWRHDRHEPLVNAAEYSVFRDEHVFRPNQLAAPGTVGALVLGYTFDSRELDKESLETTYERHLLTSLFGTNAGTDGGWRVDWTSEIAPSSFDGDVDFSRHIVHARGYLPVSSVHEFRVRAMAGGSSGALPAQRQFALGGIGSVHGYRFKETAGDGALLLNAEYRLGKRGSDANRWRLVGFLDAGRVFQPALGSSADWLSGIGGGVELGDLRLELGWRMDDIPKSLQVLVRFGPSF